MSFPTRAQRALATLAVLGALAGCATSFAPRTGTLPTGVAAGDSALSPFYAWSGALPDRAGAMLRQEPLPANAEVTAAASMQRILYTSLDARWRSGVLPVSGTLYLPHGEPPPGGWPIVAWAHGTVGVADVCAPSWTQPRPRDAHYMNRWLEQGFAVVATDYQGLGGPGPHAYLFWESEGRSVLDAVRAALAAYPGRIANQVVITGQSQGSGASLGASRIAPTYAPELKLRATIATGLVSSFPDGPVKLPPGTIAPGAPTRFNMLRLVGGSIPDGGPAADQLVNDKGRPMLALARTTCVDEMRGYEQREHLNMGNAFSVAPARLDALLLPATDMTPVRFPAPLFIGTGAADHTIPPHRQYAGVAALCAAGNPLVWKTYAGMTHNGTVNAAFDDELRFVRAAFAGSPQASNCTALADPGAPGATQSGIPFND